VRPFLEEKCVRYKSPKAVSEAGYHRFMVGIGDCNPGSLFSIPGYRTEESVIPASRRDYRLTEYILLKNCLVSLQSVHLCPPGE